MASEQVMKPCRTCRRPTMHVQKSPSHVLHLLVSILTAGFWVPVWILIALNAGSTAQCTQCGKAKGLFG